MTQQISFGSNVPLLCEPDRIIAGRGVTGYDDRRYENERRFPQYRLNFLPLPQGQRSLRPVF